MEYYGKGMVFCGNRKCELECGRKVSQIPFGKLFLVETFQPEKNGKCKHQESIGGDNN